MFLTIKPNKHMGQQGIIDRVDMAELLIDMGFSDVDPDASGQLLFCIFHNDSATKSFSVNLDKKVFHCFSGVCGVRGSAISLYALWKEVTYEQACQELQYLPKRRSIATLHKKLVERPPVMSVTARLDCLTAFINAMPLLSQTAEGASLENRGIQKKTMDWYGLKAFDATRMVDLNEDDLFYAGISNVWRKSIFSRHRVLFPFWLGKNVAFVQGRLVDDDPTRSKYMGARGTIPCMFGHSVLGQQPAEAFITEGVIDALSLAEMGYGPALGIVGTEGFKPEWAQEFRGVKEVWIAMDNDDAGTKACQKLIAVLSPYVKRVKRFIIPQPHNDVNVWLQAKR